MAGVGAAAVARTLVASVADITAMDRATRDAAFALFRAAYDGASRTRFEQDLADKQRVILLHDRASGHLKGFSTVHIREETLGGRVVTTVFSGDTVIDPGYWGQKQLQLAFWRVLVTLKLRAPTRPLYWFLVSKGYRTYLLLANAFPRSVPHADTPEDPLLRDVLHRLATERFGDQYAPETGVIRYRETRERVREGIAPVTESLLENRHVRLFAERNPAHADGAELACLADVRMRDLLRAAVRYAGVLAWRRIGWSRRQR